MDLLEVKERVIKQEVRHPWELARLGIITELIGKYTNIKEDSLILDIGCGDLFVIEHIARIYPQAKFFAVDTAFNKELIEYYNNTVVLNNLKLFPSLNEALPFISDKVDLVLLLDVIEHIKDDIEFLKGLEKYPPIGPKTKIIITVPAFQWLFCAHDKFLGHYRRYTNKLLKKHTADAGFSNIYCGYFFSSLIPLRIIQVIKEKVLRISPSMTTDLVEWKGSKGISDFLKNLLLFDYKITSLFKKAGIRIFGLSNYIICQKSA